MICLLKVIMFVANGLIFAAGSTVMGLGILIKSQSGLLGTIFTYVPAPPLLAQISNLGYLMIVVGGFLAIVGFLGCCGAMCDSKCMLLLYFIIMLILFLVEVVAGSMVVVSQPQVNKVLEDFGETVSKEISKPYVSNKDFANSLNTAMDMMKCCGYKDYTDFKSVTNYPKSCCRMTENDAGTCGEEKAKKETVEGCIYALKKALKNNSVLGGLAYGIAVFQVCAIVASFCLYKN